MLREFSRPRIDKSDIKKEPSTMVRPQIKKEEPKDTGPFGSLQIYRQRGTYLHHLEQFDRSIKAFDEACEYCPDDVNLLIRRSAACADGAQAGEALRDAQRALRLAPRDVRALQGKARALAALCEFEQSVVHNYRGFWRRTTPHHFNNGLNSGLRIIDDAIGKGTGQILLKNLHLIEQNRRKIDMDESAPEPVKRKSRIPQPKRKKILSEQETHKRALLSRVLAFKYLGPMAYDKFFLEHLLTDNRVISANSKGSQEIKRLTNKALSDLNVQQELLRASRPYYSIKQAEATESKYQNVYKTQLLKNERALNTKHAEHWLRQVEQCQRARKINDMMTKAQRMQMFLDSKSLYMFPSKDSYTDHLYQIIGRGYLSQHRLAFKTSEASHRRRISFLMGIPIERPSSYDSVIANFPLLNCDRKHTIEQTLKILETCENKTRQCFLNYSLSYLYLKSNNNNFAITYAKKCQHQAEEIDDAVWWLNGCLANMRVDMLQNNAAEIKLLVDEAKTHWTPKTCDTQQINTFLDKCLEVVVEIHGNDEFKDLEIREKNIVKTLDEETRKEFKLLCKRMSNIPFGRRFSVLPQKTEKKKASERRKHRQRHLSIIPGPDKGTNLLSHCPVPGLQIFE